MIENDNVVSLCRSELLDSIIPYIVRQVRDYCSKCNDNLHAIVFSGNINVTRSYITGKLCLLDESCEGIRYVPFLNINDWKCRLEIELQERITVLDDCKAFKIDDFVLGEPVPTNYEYVGTNLNYKGGQIKCANGVCESIKVQKGTVAFQILKSCIFPHNSRAIEYHSFSECHHYLNPLGFKVERTKLAMNKEFIANPPLLVTASLGIAMAKTTIGPAVLKWMAKAIGMISYKESLVKETSDFICELKFYSEKGMPEISNDIDFRRHMPDTLSEIIISKR